MVRLLRGLAVMAVLGGLAVLAASAALQWWEPPENPPVTAEVVANPGGERVRVEVLNAGGVAGMAREATVILRDAGFDVVDVGNAGAFDQDSSVVLARLGRTDMASRVADALAIPSYGDEPDSTVYVDVTVLIGKSWDPAIVLARAEAARNAVVVPEVDPGWRGVLYRLREWADGLNESDDQR